MGELDGRSQIDVDSLPTHYFSHILNFLLHVLLLKGNLDIVKLLVGEGGVNADEEALSLAREYDHNEVAEFLLKHVNLYSGLEGDVEIMEKACREGDVNM